MEITASVERGRDAAAQLEQVAALAMALPRRDPGPLRYRRFGACAEAAVLGLVKEAVSP